MKIYLDDDTSESEDDSKRKKSKRALNDDQFEEVPIDQRMFNFYLCNFLLFPPPSSAMKRIHLDAEDLALGHVLAQSKKSREQLVDHSYNR